MFQDLRVEILIYFCGKCFDGLGKTIDILRICVLFERVLDLADQRKHFVLAVHDAMVGSCIGRELEFCFKPRDILLQLEPLSKQGSFLFFERDRFGVPVFGCLDGFERAFKLCELRLLCGNAFAKPGKARPRLIHRLDRDTSGVILTARTKPAAGFLGKAMMGVTEDGELCVWLNRSRGNQEEEPAVLVVCAEGSGDDGEVTSEDAPFLTDDQRADLNGTRRGATGFIDDPAAIRAAFLYALPTTPSSGADKK